MKLLTREDIDLPIDAAFRAIADLDYLERQLLRAGVRVDRKDGAESGASERSWHVKGDLAGTAREADVAVSGWTAPSLAELKAGSGGMEAVLRGEFMPLSKNSTRLRVVLTVKASGFRDRMALQALVVGKSRLSEKFSKTVAAFVRDAEGRAVSV